jgi:outer membrane receptor protein involved in Fe transport
MKKILLGLILLCGVSAFAQGVTTSSINGQVKDQNGEPLPGANIIAIHQPSGTTYGSLTDFDGFYRVPNMRVGGPYKIEISYVGFKTQTLENIFLRLGDSERISVEMQEEASQLDEVVITATKDGVFDSGQKGSNTNISLREINNLPSTSRSLGDFLRQTPEAQVTDGGSISLGGQNNRYNAIYIDGAVNNDAFGLAGSGTNGGQTGVNPISIDAIESFQVNLAPFDVRQSGFAGGSINAITRSGTNNLEASAYYYLRNQDLAGKTPTAIQDDEDERERLADFTAKLIGARVGGALVKDKLFFFVNYERQDEETPQPFNFDQYQGDASLADIQDLRQNLINNFGYDPGTFLDNPSSLVSDKLITRLDWNINDKNTLTLRNSYVKAENTDPSASGDRTIEFGNAGVFFPSRTNSTTLEWSTTNGSNISNNLIVAYTDVLDDRGPIGSPFPSVRIQDGSGNIDFGSEPFSTANLLEQQIINITNNFEYYKGRHKITLGANFESFDAKNVFFRQNYGQYRFFSLDDFNSYFDDNVPDAPVRFFDYGYSLLGGVGDDSLGAAEFNYSQVGFYLQDDVDVTDNFKLSVGLRFDLPFFDDGLVNDDFNTRTVALLEANGKDLQGARVGQGIDTQLHFSPRLGFSWDVFGNNTTQIRGGAGIFTSRIPLVWPGGAYNNNGLTAGFVDERVFDGDVFFNPDPFTQGQNPGYGNGAQPGTGATGGQIDIFAPDFKLPQVAKFNLAVDQKLPFWGLIASGEFLYTDILNNIFYENVNIGGPVGSLNGEDNRSFFSRNLIDPTYSGVYLATNTSGGYAYNTTFVLRKPFSKGFSGQIAYTFGDSYNIFEGTSSQNSSQWRDLITVNGKNNNPGVQRSDFALGSRISANFSYEKEWSENFKSTIGLFYNGQQGSPYSFIYNNVNDNILNDDSRDNALIYIPRDASEINLVQNGDFTPEQQWAALDRFIESSDYLRDRRGQYAERNGTFGPWSHIIDLKFLQDFSLNFNEKKHTFQFSLDIFNFTNLINKDWGVRPFVPSSVGLIDVQEGGPDPEFTFNVDQFQSVDDIEIIDDRGAFSSRWQIQVGLRYIFK